jgi:hypothetical protein
MVESAKFETNENAAEEALADLQDEIKGRLTVIAQEILVDKKYRQVILAVEDKDRHRLERTFGPEEAETIDRAMWTSGEHMDIEAFSSQIISEIRQKSKAGAFDPMSAEVKLETPGGKITDIRSSRKKVA